MSLVIQVLAKYPNPTFIETGTKHGTAVSYATKLNFKEIHSVELDKNLYEFCRKRFQDEKYIHIYQGDSAKILPKILESVSHPFTIWLDAHQISDDIKLSECPMLQELEAIKKIKKPGDVILADDMTMFSKDDFKKIIDLAETIGSVSFENNDKFTYESVANDILVIR